MFLRLSEQSRYEFQALGGDTDKVIDTSEVMNTKA